MVRQGKPYNRRDFMKTTGAASAVGVAGLAGCLDALEDDDYPSEDIEIIVPWAAGGGTDRTGRYMAEYVQDYLDTSAYVTNITGGTGSVGHTEMANSEPDGHTIGTLDVTIVQVEHMGISEINHEAFKPIMQYNMDASAITVHEDGPIDTIEDFVEYAEDNPGELTVSTAGTGGIWHISAAAFADMADIDLRFVPYDGGEPAAQAVVNEEVMATASSAVEARPHAEGGPLEILTVFNDERLDWISDVPTLIESGYDLSIGAWRGLGAPLDTPDDRIEILEDAFTQVYEDEGWKDQMESDGFGQVFRTGDEFGEYMDEQYDVFGQVIDDLGLAED